jgi:hypothetical protein
MISIASSGNEIENCGDSPFLAMTLNNGIAMELHCCTICVEKRIDSFTVGSLKKMGSPFRRSPRVRPGLESNQRLLACRAQAHNHSATRSRTPRPVWRGVFFSKSDSVPATPKRGTGTGYANPVRRAPGGTYEPLAPNEQRLGRLCRHRQELVRESESTAKSGGKL